MSGVERYLVFLPNLSCFIFTEHIFLFTDLLCAGEYVQNWLKFMTRNIFAYISIGEFCKGTTWIHIFGLL